MDVKELQQRAATFEAFVILGCLVLALVVALTTAEKVRKKRRRRPADEEWEEDGRPRPKRPKKGDVEVAELDEEEDA